MLDKVRVMEGKETTLAGPLFAAEFLPVARYSPPRLGEHMQEVLQSLGYSDAVIRALRDKGAVG